MSDDRFLMAIHKRVSRLPWRRTVEAEPVIVASAGVGRLEIVVDGQSFEFDAVELRAAIREAA